MSWSAGFTKVATLIKYADTATEAATLGNELAKAWMGDDYDPAYRDKLKEVVDVGQKVDALVADLAAKQSDIDNLEAVIKMLNLSLDLNDFKSSQVGSMLDKVATFNFSFASTPTAYTWVAGPTAMAGKHISSQDLNKAIAEVGIYNETRKLNPLTVGILTPVLVVKGAFYLHEKYKKPKKNNVSEIEMVQLPPKPRRNAVYELPEADLRASRNLRNKGARRSLAKSVGSTAISALSLGLVIYGVFHQFKERNSSFAALEKQLQYYKFAAIAYEYCVQGAGSSSSDELKYALELVESARKESTDPNSPKSPTELEHALTYAENKLSVLLKKDSLFQSVKAFFQVDDPNNPEKKVPWSVEDDLALAFGLVAIIKQYEDQGDSILQSIRLLFKDMITSLEDAHQSTDSTDENDVKQYVTEINVIDELKRDKAIFEYYAAIACDRLKHTQMRKNKGFDPIQDKFKNSLQVLMSKVVNAVSEKLRDVQFASQLLVSAKSILNDAETEKEKVDSRAASAIQQNEKWKQMIKQILGASATEADITNYMQENKYGATVETFDRDAFIALKAKNSALGEWVASDLDTNGTERFPNQESAHLCMLLMLADLQKIPPN